MTNRVNKVITLTLTSALISDKPNSAAPSLRHLWTCLCDSDELCASRTDVSCFQVSLGTCWERVSDSNKITVHPVPFTTLLLCLRLCSCVGKQTDALWLPPYLELIFVYKLKSITTLQLGSVTNKLHTSEHHV